MTGPRVRLLLVGLVALGGLALAFVGLDARALRDALGSVRLGWLPVAMACVTAVFAARVLRFHVLLGEHAPSLARQVEVSFIGFLAINVVPFRLGEFVRPVLLADDGVPWGRTLAAIAVERVLDLLMLLVMLLLTGLAVDLPSRVVVQGVDVLHAGQRASAVGALALLVALLGLFVAGPTAAGLLERVPRVGPRLAGLARAGGEAVRSLARRPVAALLATALAAAVWGLTVSSVYVLLLAFPELPVRADIALSVTAVTVAGTVAIPTPGHVGPFEVFCKAALVLWAVPAELAAAFALVWHAHAFGFHVATGGATLAWRGLSLGALVERSRAPR